MATGPFYGGPGKVAVRYAQDGPGSRTRSSAQILGGSDQGSFHARGRGARVVTGPPLSSLSSFIALETLMARICWSKGKSKGTWRPGVAITLCAHSNVTAAFSGSYAIGNLNWATGATRCSSHTLAHLRMANLDAFWAIEPRTVAAQVREVASSVRVGRNELGLPMFGALGPWRTTMAIGRR